VISRRLLVSLAAAGIMVPFRRAFADEDVKDADKIPQSEAQYQQQPKGQQRCEICLQFNPPNRCKIVRGKINPQGWCQFFAARENAH
jgi:hypothetical protein